MYNIDFNHVRLVHAQGTKLEEVVAQQRFREEARYVALNADNFDMDLAVLDVVTMFEKLNIKVFVPP